MPQWVIYHTKDALSDTDSKGALTADITKIYTGIGLPAFYVVVIFIQLESSNMWVGGKPREERFVRLAIDHIAVNLPDDDAERARVATKIDEVLKPHIADKGYEWEFSVDETDRRLWQINGFVPPPFGSEGEKLWAKENRTVPYQL